MTLSRAHKYKGHSLVRFFTATLFFLVACRKTRLVIFRFFACRAAVVQSREMAVPSLRGSSESVHEGARPHFQLYINSRVLPIRETQRIMAQGTYGLEKLIFEERLRELQMYSIIMR